jgi:hypothetical protein
VVAGAGTIGLDDNGWDKKDKEGETEEVTAGEDGRRGQGGGDGMDEAASAIKPIHFKPKLTKKKEEKKEENKNKKRRSPVLGGEGGSFAYGGDSVTNGDPGAKRRAFPTAKKHANKENRSASSSSARAEGGEGGAGRRATVREHYDYIMITL